MPGEGAITSRGEEGFIGFRIYIRFRVRVRPGGGGGGQKEAC